MEAVSVDVFEAAVRVAGQAIFWKSGLKHILRSAGVPDNACTRYESLSKYVMFRSIWDDLDRAGEEGRRVQHDLIKQLANLDKPQDNADAALGTQAIMELRRLAQMSNLLIDPDEQEVRQRQRRAAEKQELRDVRREKLAALGKRFGALFQQSNPQRRGYDFERLLRDLFLLYELHFDASYKTETDQIDGHVKFDSFSYLVEARWRKEVAVEADLGGLTMKAERRLDGTRGLFISMAGFRPEVVSLYRRARDSRLVLVDGEDLAVIFQGRIELPEALREKVLAASREGEPLVRLAALSR